MYLCFMPLSIVMHSCIYHVVNYHIKLSKVDTIKINKWELASPIFTVRKISDRNLEEPTNRANLVFSVKNFKQFF